jgi:diguanylate cyclase (GGDEF)-like protein
VRGAETGPSAGRRACGSEPNRRVLAPWQACAYTQPLTVSEIQQPERPSKAPLPERIVLVVDDEEPTRGLVVRWLKSAGFVCREARSGEQALSLLGEEPEAYETVVLDVMMPGMDGFEVLSRLKSDPRLVGIPVVILTASASEDDIVRGVEAGAVDYLLKPFSGPVLIAKLRAVRQRSQAEWRLQRKLRFAEQSATTDGLTGLSNRRSFDERLVEMTAQAVRHNEPLALMMLDIDRFKSINDEYGHPAGDVALRFVADRIRRVLRVGDLAFRYGGEEFVTLLRKCDAIGAMGVYDRLRDELKKEAVDLGHGVNRSITISGGIATSEKDTGFRTEGLVARADAALYAAKHNGRDRVEVEKPLSG